MSEIGKRTQAEAIALAEFEGLEAFFAQPDELFIDLDVVNGLVPAHVLKVMSNHGYNTKHYPALTTKSKSDNTHVYIKLDMPVNHITRLLLQAVLGSDPVREFLSFLRLNEGSDSAICFFETPAEAENVRKWRSEYNPFDYNDIS